LEYFWWGHFDSFTGAPTGTLGRSGLTGSGIFKSKNQRSSHVELQESKKLQQIAVNVSSSGFL
jgi:hypothetical protein